MLSGSIRAQWEYSDSFGKMPYLLENILIPKLNTVLFLEKMAWNFIVYLPASNSSANNSLLVDGTVPLTE